jgi:hypothetical protein
MVGDTVADGAIAAAGAERRRRSPNRQLASTSGVRGALGLTNLGGEAVDRSLDRVEGRDARQQLLGDRRLGSVMDLEQLALRMRPGRDVGDPLRPGLSQLRQGIVARVGVGMEPA